MLTINKSQEVCWNLNPQIWAIVKVLCALAKTFSNCNKLITDILQRQNILARYCKWPIIVSLQTQQCKILRDTTPAWLNNIHGANRIFFELLIRNWLGQCPSSLFSSDWWTHGVMYSGWHILYLWEIGTFLWAKRLISGCSRGTFNAISFWCQKVTLEKVSAKWQVTKILKVIYVFQ